MSIPVTRQPIFSGVLAACGQRADVASRQAVQPGRIGEPHRRLHAGGGAEILVVEHQMCLLGRVLEIHLPSALSAWGI